MEQGARNMSSECKSMKFLLANEGDARVFNVHLELVRLRLIIRFGNRCRLGPGDPGERRGRGQSQPREQRRPPRHVPHQFPPNDVLWIYVIGREERKQYERYSLVVPSTALSAGQPGRLVRPVGEWPTLDSPPHRRDRSTPSEQQSRRRRRACRLLKTVPRSRVIRDRRPLKKVSQHSLVFGEIGEGIGVQNREKGA